MVQYVFTPWRDRQELLLVRDQFYHPAAGSAASIRSLSRSQADLPSEREAATGDLEVSSERASTRRRASHEAVARVGMWMQRGNCPHMVESTALLVAAVLSDEECTSKPGGGESLVTAADMYAVRAAYSAAFSRFVTGLLDGHQDKQRKQSMYSVAKTIGLPATFVELRHQSTHEQLPSVAKLRSAAKQALEWIWDYYWKHLKEDNQGRGSQSDPLSQLVLEYLKEDDEIKQLALATELYATAEEPDMEKTIKDLQRTLPGNQAYLKCAKLREELKALKAKQSVESKTEEQSAPSTLQSVRDDDQEEGDESDCGWGPYKGVWKPKPIGIS